MRCPSPKTMRRLISNSILNLPDLTVGQLNKRGKTIYMGTTSPRQTLPSPICKSCISVASLKNCPDPMLSIDSTRTSCSSSDLMVATLMSTLTSPVKGWLILQFVLCTFPLIVLYVRYLTLPRGNFRRVIEKHRPSHSCVVLN